MAPSDESAAAIREHPEGVTLQLQVQPRAARARFGPLCGPVIKAAVTAPPVEGAANAAVVALVAATLGVGARAVALLTGSRGRRKLVRVAGVTRQDVLDVLAEPATPRARPAAVR